MIHLQLITLSGTKLDDSVYEVLLPTIEGQIGVMTGHMPLISVATNGVVSVRRQEHDIDAAMEHYAVSGGIIEITDNRVRVLVDEADHADDINEAEAQAAHERALKLKGEAADEASLEKAQAIIDRTRVRLHVANLKRHHRK